MHTGAQNPSGLLAYAAPSLCGRIWRSLKTRSRITSAERGHGSGVANFKLTTGLEWQSF